MTGTGGRRVTLVVNAAEGVSETFLRSLATVLGQLGHTVTVHSTRPARGRTAMRPAVDERGWTSTSAFPTSPAAIPFAVGWLAGHRQIARSVLRAAVARHGRSRRALRAWVDAIGVAVSEPDIVHFGFSGIAVNMADAIDLLGDARTVVSCRGTGEQVRPVVDPERAAALGDILRRVDAIHAVSDALAATIVELGAPSDRVTVIRPAIDIERFRRASPVPASPHAPFRLVTVARLHWIKGLDDLLNALAVLRRTHEATLDIVGDGPESEALRFRAVALGLGDAVHFAGAVGPDRVRAALEQSDAFVLTSLSEGISNAVLEAMALDLPVVSTDVGGMREVITDGVDGLLVPPGDPAALAAALARLIADDELRLDITGAGAERVRTQFTLARQRSELASLYGSLA